MSLASCLPARLPVLPSNSRSRYPRGSFTIALPAAPPPPSRLPRHVFRSPLSISRISSRAQSSPPSLKPSTADDDEAAPPLPPGAFIDLRSADLKTAPDLKSADSSRPRDVVAKIPGARDSLHVPSISFRYVYAILPACFNGIHGNFAVTDNG